MRPTICEQFDQAGRILDQVIMPTVSEARARDILRGVVDNLRMLGPALVALPAFLQWDNDAMRSLLDGLGVQVTDQEPAEVVPTVPYLSVAERSNEELRQQLCDLISRLDPDDTRLVSVRTHLAERSARFPMRAIPPTPQGGRSQ